jgi:hypothetical protein
MGMDLLALQKKLLEAGRADRPRDHVPYAFEKRVLAHLASLRPADIWEELARGLWRAAAPCIAIMILLCAWSLFAPAGISPAGDLSAEFDRLVLAAADQEQSPDSSW